MLEVEVLAREPIQGFSGERADGAGEDSTASIPSQAEIERLCARALATAGVKDAHLAIEFVSAARIAELNAAHRGKEGPTDVLSFPIDELESLGGALERTDGNGIPRELGDIVICPAHTRDLREAIVHGALHLLGMDHETDSGEMLVLQDRIMGEALQ